jgi:2-oxoglutarate/2-oxoacid ferredoxin oxidoreductase subunit alpha
MVCAWYPITPATSLADAFESNCARYLADRATKKKNYAIVQAENEVAAIGVAVGAGWNGARAFTATSGPGISLMQEFFGLAYFAEVPVVLFDVQRGGPSTGMPTRTQQSDLLAAAFASHGDTKHVLLIPDGPGETFEFGASALDFAERPQTLVFVMPDLDIGMNAHITSPFRWENSRATIAAECSAARSSKQPANSAAMTMMSTATASLTAPCPAHTRRAAPISPGRHRNRFARYAEESGRYVDNMERLLRKFETARSLLPRPVLKLAAKRLASASFTMDRPRRPWPRLRRFSRMTVFTSTRYAFARSRQRSKSPN